MGIITALSHDKLENCTVVHIGCPLLFIPPDPVSDSLLHLPGVYAPPLVVLLEVEKLHSWCDLNPSGPKNNKHFGFSQVNIQELKKMKIENIKQDNKPN